MSNSQYVVALPMYTHINIILCNKFTIYRYYVGYKNFKLPVK